eukprot:COSAG01_NODE_3676_length_5804_cov_8.195968_2_plen_110_part_00
MATLCCVRVAVPAGTPAHHALVAHKPGRERLAAMCGAGAEASEFALALCDGVAVLLDHMRGEINYMPRVASPVLRIPQQLLRALQLSLKNLFALRTQPPALVSHWPGHA